MEISLRGGIGLVGVGELELLLRPAAVTTGASATALVLVSFLAILSGVLLISLFALRRLHEPKDDSMMMISNDTGPAVVHSAASIEAMLRRGLSPITDNQTALVTLGFCRAYPQISKGYDATIWERAVELPGLRSGCRQLARERAFLVAAGRR